MKSSPRTEISSPANHQVTSLIAIPGCEVQRAWIRAARILVILEHSCQESCCLFFRNYCYEY